MEGLGLRVVMTDTCAARTVHIHSLVGLQRVHCQYGGLRKPPQTCTSLQRVDTLSDESNSPITVHQERV